MLCRATQDGHVMVESSNKPRSTGDGMADYFSILALRTLCSVQYLEKYSKQLAYRGWHGVNRQEELLTGGGERW